MLQLVKSSRRDRYARDRDWMIQGACGLLKRTYIRPAEALWDILKIMGWKVENRPLLCSGYADTVKREKTIIVCSNLRSKLSHPDAAEGVALFAVTQQYAHIRMHFFSGVPQPGPKQIEEAKLYAGIFLVPRRQVLEHPVYFDMLEDGKRGACLWTHVGYLAQFFGITRGHMVRELQSLGIVALDEQSRELTLAA